MYSIIVPAHNEEKYISRTLQKLTRLDHSEYEVIVVENGSTDRTHEIAKRFKSKRIRVYSVKSKGVSAARNFGAAKATKRSEWLIFLDADTWLEKGFLNELDRFLADKDESYVTGSAAILPIEKSTSMKALFSVINIVHRMFKISGCPQIVRRELFEKAKFDEQMQIGEDMQLHQMLMRQGRFFFLSTCSVSTSARRFYKGNRVSNTLKLLTGFLTPAVIRRKMDYEVVR